MALVPIRYEGGSTGLPPCDGAGGLERQDVPVNRLVPSINPKPAGYFYIERVRIAEALLEGAQRRCGFRAEVNILAPDCDLWTALEFQRGLDFGVQS